MARKTKRRTFTSGAVGSAGALVFVPDKMRGGEDLKPVLRIGLAADAQYADVDPENNRYYREGAPRLAAAIKEFNGLDLDFCVYLGDLIDRSWESFDKMEAVMNESRHPLYSVLGNHDFEVPDEWKEKVPEQIGMKERYYSMERKGFRFLFLDTTDVSTFAHPSGSEETAFAETELAKWKAKNIRQAYSWNGAIGERQMKWIERELQAARTSGQKVIVFSHNPVAPEGTHLIWNAEDVLKLIAGYAHIAGWFCGHNHDGAFVDVGEVPFVTMCGMVETRETTAYAVMEVFEDRLVVSGRGREVSRELMFGAV